ncbi:unnamed protein product [Mytilus coruscus]|uniref:Uncharacterized protein n=1 Tax=Mytilus coruscus TaxID=42192 RepID=A0A6J8ENT0_MYTCO|nr:unnamed protein product [Mytilus coruscus]
MNESESISKPIEENTNYGRINRLLQRAATPAVRHEFNKQFHPSAPSSSDFDLTLMMCLLRTLTSIYESDVFPLETDTSEAACLMRLKHYRYLIGHNKELTLSNKDFTKYWAHITDAICKLGGENYRKTCMQLRCTSLDESEKDIHLEIKKIAKGIREDNKEEYPYWIEDTERYFPISAAIKQIIEEFDKCKHHFVVVSGKPGTGKTALARYVALNLHKNNDVSIVPANNPDIINNLLALRTQNNVTIHPVKIKNMPVQNDRHGKKKQKLTNAPDIEKIQNNQANKVRVLALDDSHSSQTTQIKTIFAIDDFLGRNTINKRVTNAWKQLFYEHFDCPNNTTDSIYILVTCREEIRQTSQFRSLKSIYQFLEYNLSWESVETIAQKLDIASCHMNPSTSEQLFTEIEVQKVDRFHTLCLLYSQLHHIENVNFFKDPYSVFNQEFEEIRTLSEPCYIGLALLTIFDGKLGKPLYDQNIGKLVRELCVECGLLQNDMKLSKIQKDINMVVGRYIIDEGTSYYVVHPELYDILLNYFIKKIPKSLINFGSNDFLQTRVALQGSIHYCYNSFTGVHPIGKQHEELVFNRLIEDIIKNKFENALCNIQVTNTAYQEELIRHVQKSDEVLQILASSCLPLILSVENDFSQILDLILKEREKLNLSQEVEFERQDNYDVIDYDDRKLLNLQSSINDKEIILMLACLYGSVRVVKLLLSLDYDINYQNSMQKSPIHLACLRGNDEVVKLLLGLQSTGIKDDDDNQTLDGLECDIDI